MNEYEYDYEGAVNILSAYMVDTGDDQATIAEKAGVSPGALTHIMKHRMVVSPGLAAEFERTLGIPAEKFRPDVFNGLTAKPGL